MAVAVQRSPDGYAYLDLSRARDAVSQYQNFYGVVTDWDAARKSRGSAGDWFCNFYLKDVTLDDTQVVKLRVFGRDLAQLPHPRRTGDIIRIHRARVETEFSGSVVLVASLNPNKPGIPKPAFCLFDGRPSTEERESNAPRPYQVSSGKTYHWDSKESLIVGQLRQFSEEWVGQENMQFRRPISCLVERVEEMGQFGDLVGLVLAVEAGEDGQQPVVWMWDGSDAPPFKLTDTTASATAGAAATAEPPAPQEQMRRLEFPLRSLSQAAAAAMPVVGTAVPVIIASPKELPAPGAWIKLRNCLFYVLEGQVQGRMLEKSRWRPRQEDKALVKEYARRVKQGIMSACAPPQEQWFTCTSHGDQPVSPLRKLAVEEMTQPGVPMSYRCVVRVLATQPPPSDVATASIPGTLVHDSTNAAGSAAPVEWLYALQLRVEDGSGSLFVDVYGEDGALFFSEIAPPQDLRASPQARDAVGTALGQLMGEGCSEPQGCWMEVCVLRYWPNSQGGAPRYRVFDTKVLASRMQS